MSKSLVMVIICLFLASVANAWDGYDYNDGEFIEIDKGNLVRSGEEIEVFHYGSGEYRYEEVESVSSDEVETYDYETGEYNTYDMD